MSDIVIIGNGFDLSHGIKSTYYDFYNFLCENGYSEFVRQIEKYIDSSELWNDFEAALGYIDIESLKEEASEYIVDYGSDEWRDSCNHSYQDYINDELSFARNIKEFLYDWILQIDLQGVTKNVELKMINNNNIFINFNYTRTLEEIYDINPNNVLHIHGTVGEKELIVGHGYKRNKEREEKNNVIEYENKNYSREELEEIMFEEYAREQEERENYEDDFRFIEAENRIDKYYKRTYKNTEFIIKQKLEPWIIDRIRRSDTIEKIWVLGHSIGEVDLIYFDYINKLFRGNIIWIVSYHRDYEKDIILERFLRLEVCISNIKLFKL